MRGSARASLLYLAIGLTDGFPNPILPSTTTIVNTITVLPVQASPFPAGPTTNEFLYLNFDEESKPDKAKRLVIHDAFEDWAAVVQKAIESLTNTQDNTYQAWFPDSVNRNKKPVREFLAGVYETLFDSSADPAAPLPYVASFVCDNTDFFDDGVGGCDGTTTAYCNRLKGKFHVCPFGMESQPTKATGINCDTLGDVVSDRMNSLTGTLVHEFMHSRNAGDATPDGKFSHDMLENHVC
jgi:hypothetical protein